MKSLFHKGQPVTPNKQNSWRALNYTGKDIPQPKFGEIYHVSGDYIEDGNVFITLREFNPMYGFFQNDFSPVISDKQLEDALKEVDELVTVKNIGALI
jgi:hypothetical protein